MNGGIEKFKKVISFERGCWGVLQVSQPRHYFERKRKMGWMEFELKILIIYTDLIVRNTSHTPRRKHVLRGF